MFNTLYNTKNFQYERTFLHQIVIMFIVILSHLFLIKGGWKRFLMTSSSCISNHDEILIFPDKALTG